MNIARKLAILGCLCLGFAVVLTLIYQLSNERMDYAAALLRATHPDSGINDYRMIARSSKYGMLLVIFTFAVFFLYEILHNLRIHPIQYLLVGAALSVFYLLLLSFAEQIGFTPAYLIAAAACISLIMWYLQFVISERKALICIAALLLGGYTAMFVLLRLPLYSLLLGSILVFAALFGVMYLTRHVDWYALQAPTQVKDNQVPTQVKHDED